MIEWGKKSKLKKIPGPKFNPQKIKFPSHKNFQRNNTAGIRGNYHNTPKNLLKSSYQKNSCQNLKFQTQNILWSFLSLEIESTPPPTSPCLDTKCAALWYVFHHGNYSFYLKDNSVQQMCSQIHANIKWGFSLLKLITSFYQTQPCQN